MFTDGVEDPAIKIQLLLGENTEQSTHAGPLTTGHAPSHQASQSECQDILEESITPHLAKSHKTIAMLELWRARPLLA